MYKSGEIHTGQNKPGNHNAVIITIIIAVTAIIITLLVLLLMPKSDKTDAVREVIVEPKLPDNTVDTSAGAPNAAPSTPSPEARKQSLLNDYEKILRQNPSESYLMTDLNNNGFPELWITYNVGKNADGMIHVYHGEKGHAREIYSLYADVIATKGKYVITEQGDGFVSLYTYDGSRVKESYEDADRFLDDNSIRWYNQGNMPSTRNTAPLHQAFR